jgi:hypothetical protein
VDFKELITGYDVHGLEPGHCVASISFSELSSEISYCVGYRHKGGSQKNPQNYKFDHVNIRLKERDSQIKVHQNLIAEILTKYNMDINSLLVLYCSMIILPEE